MLFKGMTFTSGKKKVLVKFILGKRKTPLKKITTSSCLVFKFKFHILCLLKVT